MINVVLVCVFFYIVIGILCIPLLGYEIREEQKYLTIVDFFYIVVLSIIGGPFTLFLFLWFYIIRKYEDIKFFEKKEK